MTATRITDLSRLASPAGRLSVVEEAGVLGGTGVLVLEPASWPAEVESVARYLRDVPAVTALVATPDSIPAHAQTVIHAVDLWLSSADDLVPVERVVEEKPFGAYSLVALTRVSAAMSAADGIWAESATFSALMGSRPYLEWLKTKPARKDREEPASAVLVEEGDGLLHLTLNRPQVRNALDSRLRDELVAVLETAEVMPEVRVELRGAGVCFSAGGDLSEFGMVDDPITAHAVRATRHPALALSRIADRVTAYVHGPSVGAGVELAAFAGRVIAMPDATFRLPEVAMGLIPGAGGTWSVVQRMGRHRANWFMLTGASLDAETALAWGLVDEIDPT